MVVSDAEHEDCIVSNVEALQKNCAQVSSPIFQSYQYDISIASIILSIFIPIVSMICSTCITSSIILPPFPKSGGSAPALRPADSRSLPPFPGQITDDLHAALERLAASRSPSRRASRMGQDAAYMSQVHEQVLPIQVSDKRRAVRILEATCRNALFSRPRAPTHPLLLVLSRHSLGELR